MTTFFGLNRKVDITGMSGVGIVAVMMELDSGQCMLAWDTDDRDIPATVGWYPNKETVEAIHGHNGATELIELTEAAEAERAATIIAALMPDVAPAVHEAASELARILRL